MRIETRDELGTRPFRTPPTIIPLSQRQEVTIHYPGAGIPPRDLRGYRQWVEKIHMDQNGWRGVGYNFLIDADGRVGEGCGRDVQGAHSPPHNVDGIGINVWTENGIPTEAGKRAARELYDQLCREAGRTLRIGWHGRDYATDCPGPALKKWAQEGMQLPTTRPTPAPEIPKKEAQMGWQIQVGTKDNDVVGWVLHVLYNLFAYDDFSDNPVAGRSFELKDGTPTGIFQDMVGVKCTGLIDEETWRWSEKWAGPFALHWENARPGGLPLDIRAVQLSLMKLGFMDWKHRADIGTFGPATTKAVNDYIRARGLGTPDGKVGPKTFGTLSAEARLFNCTTPIGQLSRPTTGPASIPAPAGTVQTPVPGSWISAVFGQKPKNNTYWRAKGYHTGRDYAASHGTPILAVRNGTVHVRDDAVLGCIAILEADNGRFYWYCHTTRGSRVTGRVKAGQKIATVGATGSGASGGPHCHFEDAASGSTWGVGLRDPRWN